MLFRKHRPRTCFWNVVVVAQIDYLSLILKVQETHQLQNQTLAVIAVRQAQDHQVPKDLLGLTERTELTDHQDLLGLTERTELTDHQVPKDHKDLKETLDHQDFRVPKVSKVTKDPREIKATNLHKKI
jgi:hypothetical protein